MHILWFYDFDACKSSSSNFISAPPLPTKLKPVEGIDAETLETIAAPILKNVIQILENAITVYILKAQEPIDSSFKFCCPKNIQVAIRTELVNTNGDITAANVLKEPQLPLKTSLF